MIVKNQWVIDELKEEIIKYSETKNNENKTTKIYALKNSSKRNSHSDTGLSQ